MARTAATTRSPSRGPLLVGVRADLRASGRERRHEGGPLSATPASRRTPKADKRRREGGSHRPISAPSMWIGGHDALLAGPLHRFYVLPNPARRRLTNYRRWPNG